MTNFKVQIAYYESEFTRTVRIKEAAREGRDQHRPFRYSGEATYPVLPRPGDRVSFRLGKEYHKYFERTNPCQAEDGSFKITGQVQWAEILDGEEDIFLHVTEVDSGPYGRLCDEEKAKMEAFVGGPIDWR